MAAVSLTDWSLTSEPRFVGLGNYARMLADKIALQVRQWMDEGFSLAKGGLRRLIVPVPVLFRERRCDP